MTFKISQGDIQYLLRLIITNREIVKVDKKSPLEEKLESIGAWLETMPENEKYVYLLGRKA